MNKNKSNKLFLSYQLNNPPNSAHPALSVSILNKPERVFGLQVRWKELDTFKILEIFWDIFWIFLDFFLGIFLGGFFWRNILGEIFLEDFLGRILLEDFLREIISEELLSRN